MNWCIISPVQIGRSSWFNSLRALWDMEQVLRVLAHDINEMLGVPENIWFS